MTSEQIRQKAREAFEKFWTSTNNSNFFAYRQISITDLKTVAYESWIMATAFAESLLSGGAQIRCWHCSEPVAQKENGQYFHVELGRVNCQLDRGEEALPNIRAGATPPAASPQQDAREECAKLAEAEANLYQQSAEACDKGGNTVGGTHDGISASTLKRFAKLLRDGISLREASGSGTPAAPSAEHLAKSLKGSQDAHDAEGRAWSEWMSVAIAAAVAAEREQWQNWGIIELAVRNTNVASYVEHWESRAEKAEAALASLKAAGEGWIPCAERLPEMAGQFSFSNRVDFFVPALDKEDRWQRGRLWKNPSHWQSMSAGAFTMEDVTHWRPLPLAPAKPAEGPAAKEGK